jgi:CheY-like chemotaxis protein
MMTTRLHKKTIMIVDDRPSHIRILIEILGDGFDVSSANSGGEAIAMIHQKMPDLMLLDILMPDIDGRQVLRYVRDYERKMKVDRKDRVKIVMTSAMGFLHGGMKALHSECDGYITKPVTKENLFEVLRTVGFLK